MALVQNATILIIIPLDIDCERHVKNQFLAILNQKYLTTTFLLGICIFLSFSKIVWLDMTVKPSISIENKYKIDMSIALLLAVKKP